MLIWHISIVSIHPCSSLGAVFCTEILTCLRTHLLPDPTSFETPLLGTTMTVALDELNRGCLVRHEGLGGVRGKSGEKIVGEAWNMAEDRIKVLRAILERR